MKLTEYEGKQLLSSYGIAIPRGELVHKDTKVVSLSYPIVLKSQVHAGDRKRKGGILLIEVQDAFTAAAQQLFDTAINGEQPECLLAEEIVNYSEEMYVSFSYSGDTQGPVCLVNSVGGTGLSSATVIPIDLLQPFDAAAIQQKAGIRAPITGALEALWKLFIEKKLLLVEINPLFVCADGSLVAGDAKVVEDEAVVHPGERRYLELGGDIALLASGGGASMLALDALMRSGGKAFNYTEYSGNPKAAVVEELTKKVLSHPGLRGCFVVGAAANFTDIYETLSGFLQGLRALPQKPTYPIVIRRDGPRREEAFALLKEVSEKEGYNFHLYDSQTPISESARIMVDLAYKQS